MEWCVLGALSNQATCRNVLRNFPVLNCFAFASFRYVSTLCFALLCHVLFCCVLSLLALTLWPAINGADLFNKQPTRQQISAHKTGTHTTHKHTQRETRQSVNNV